MTAAVCHITLDKIKTESFCCLRKRATTTEIIPEPSFHLEATLSTVFEDWRAVVLIKKHGISFLYSGKPRLKPNLDQPRLWIMLGRLSFKLC